MESLLRRKIEEMTGRKPVTPRDFAWFCETVMKRTRERVSGSTLRRFCCSGDMKPTVPAGCLRMA